MDALEMRELADFLTGLDSHSVYEVAIITADLPDSQIDGDKLIYAGKSLHLPIEKGKEIVRQMKADHRGGEWDDTLPDEDQVFVGYRLAASLVSQIVPPTFEPLHTAQRMMGRGSAHRAYVEALRAYAQESE